MNAQPLQLHSEEHGDYADRAAERASLAHQLNRIAEHRNPTNPTGDRPTPDEVFAALGALLDAAPTIYADDREQQLGELRAFVAGKFSLPHKLDAVICQLHRKVAASHGLVPVRDFMVEQLCTSGWEDANWTENEKPLRFVTVRAAESAIREFLNDVREAVDRGDMIDGHSREEFRIVPTPRHLRRRQPDMPPLLTKPGRRRAQARSR
ncbi:hypothetical protein [Oleiharenicola sp. Vm1]|uniref:hypothetical protein n=1 Tax=Oleiharenicola sp. Vm1 TaxID=3398393 RepID=UPI0039F52BC3